MSMVPKEINTLNGIPIIIAPTLFSKLEQAILKFVWNHKRPKIAKAVLIRKNKPEGITIPCCKIYTINIHTY